MIIDYKAIFIWLIGFFLECTDQNRWTLIFCDFRINIFLLNLRNKQKQVCPKIEKFTKNSVELQKLND